jgi:glycosidase
MLTTRVFRITYDLSLDVFRPDGHLVFGDLGAARQFAARMSARRAEAVPAADLYALSLLDEAFHLLLQHFSRMNPGVLDRARAELLAGLGPAFEEALVRFIGEYPPIEVQAGARPAASHLASHPNSSDLLPEMLVIHNANRNPALDPYRELFDETVMDGSAYADLLKRLFAFLASLPPARPGLASPGETLTEMLEAPIKASPNSIEGQLRFIAERWGHVLGESFSARLLRGLDFIREEIIRRHGPQAFRAEAQVHFFSGQDYAEYERYSPDRDWMPRLVLIAKNSYVWLDQLSRKYQREIRSLDQIPDEELDLLAGRGFTGLWLIGLWERSRASQRIKQRMGQEEAVASAYSLHSYDIAADLGGWGALANLRARAWERGIRLSADMVPNHMGIDSTWVVEHPDWFLSADQPPYPSYSFASQDLSDDGRVGIHLEDHYYDKADAAVVFLRRDKWTGDLKYIYHGNDGTSFPWNDTAQLDYSKAHVREAVIQTILHVARNFPVIRFDAAMTLAKKHIQRLWFPEPGAGGAIPSRSQYGLTKAEFDAAIPQEFWREVVDRVAVEVPDTLLLAEAFWLMEGYFVRTLGMHRVYNSAFMHMLRDEDNAKYRAAIRNTLEFDPQILKRYVNFMNNPDEKTAVEQFGSGDKYFGVATLLCTLPGLPMFGHGQVEGYYEKYGMEFRRPKWDERVDEGLVRGHEWRIFPLLHRRYLFADVEHFLLYDFYTSNGRVNEEVFAHSNRFADERGLVVYHNKFADTRGWIKTSCACRDKASGDLRQKSLAEGLGLPFEGYAIFRDYVSHLEYIRPCEELWDKGLYVELNAYQAHVFLDWRFVEDERWAAIHRALNGAGVPSMMDQWESSLAAAQPAGPEPATIEAARARPAGKKPVKSKKRGPAGAVKKAAARAASKQEGKATPKKTGVRKKAEKKKAGNTSGKPAPAKKGPKPVKKKAA